MNKLLIAALLFCSSCSKSNDLPKNPECKWVDIYMDSLYQGKVVSSFLGYHELLCGDDLNGFHDGESLICDSNHVRRVKIVDQNGK